MARDHSCIYNYNQNRAYFPTAFAASQYGVYHRRVCGVHGGSPHRNRRLGSATDFAVAEKEGCCPIRYRRLSRLVVRASQLLPRIGSNFPIAAESRRPVSGLVAVIPFVIAVVALFASKSIRAINAATPSSWLIAVGTYRVAGIMFIFPFLTYRIVPAGFGWPAGIGDALTGIFAPVVALMVARNRPNAFKWAVAWDAFGTLDLIVAPATALYFQSRVLALYPLALVLLFLGPPLGILTHILLV